MLMKRNYSHVSNSQVLNVDNVDAEKISRNDYRSLTMKLSAESPPKRPRLEDDAPGGVKTLNPSLSHSKRPKVSSPFLEKQIMFTESDLPPNPVVKALLDGKLQEFHRLLFKTVIGHPYFSKIDESNVGDYFLGWLTHATYTGCTVKSDQEESLGRYTTIIEHQKTRQAVILGHRVNQKSHIQTVTEKAKEAISHIEERHYFRKISNEIKQVVLVGVAFQGNLVMTMGKVYKKEGPEFHKISKYIGKVLGEEVEGAYDEHDPENEEDGSENENEKNDS